MDREIFDEMAARVTEKAWREIVDLDFIGIKVSDDTVYESIYDAAKELHETE